MVKIDTHYNNSNNKQLIIHYSLQKTSLYIKVFDVYIIIAKKLFYTSILTVDYVMIESF